MGAIMMTITFNSDDSDCSDGGNNNNNNIQIVTDVDYWRLFPPIWKYSPRPKDEGNISNGGEIIFNSHR